jgi:hypothetical protein
MIASLAEQPWWTEADDAELDLLTAEIVDPVWAHRRRCEACAIEGWCDEVRTALADALDVVLDWRRRRILRSRAIGLRLRQELEELREDARHAA